MKITDYQDATLRRNLEIIKALEQKIPPPEIARALGISLATVYNVRKKAESQGLSALTPKSRAPKTKKERDPLVVNLILQIRRDTGFGAEKIHDCLIEKFGLKEAEIPKERTIHTILKEHGEITQRRAQKPFDKPDFYNTRSKKAPNYILEVDMKTDHYLEKRPVIVHGVIDICSRVVTAEVNGFQTAEYACLTLLEHVYRWGTANIVKTDNDMAHIGQPEGTNFGLFSRLCLYLGMEQLFIPIRQPRWNPHIESFFRSWDREFFNQIYHHGWDALIQGNRGFIQRYLTERSHQGVKKLPHNPEKIKFPQAYHEKHANPSFPKLPKEILVALIRNNQIPLVEGKISFIRRVPEDGVIHFKQNHFEIPKSYIGTMVKGTIFVTPREKDLKVEFYFKEHQIKTAIYAHKKYQRGRI